MRKYDKVYSEVQQCKKFNSRLLTWIIQLECNAVTSPQYCRRETIDLNPVPTDITENALKGNICKALSRTGVNVILNNPNDLHACHFIKRLDSCCQIQIS